MIPNIIGKGIASIMGYSRPSTTNLMNYKCICFSLWMINNTHVHFVYWYIFLYNICILFISYLTFHFYCGNDQATDKEYIHSLNSLYFPFRIKFHVYCALLFHRNSLCLVLVCKIYVTCTYLYTLWEKEHYIQPCTHINTVSIVLKDTVPNGLLLCYHNKDGIIYLEILYTMLT